MAPRSLNQILQRVENEPFLTVFQGTYQVEHEGIDPQIFKYQSRTKNLSQILCDPINSMRKQ